MCEFCLEVEFGTTAARNSMKPLAIQAHSFIVNHRFLEQLHLLPPKRKSGEFGILDGGAACARDGTLHCVLELRFFGSG